jgi:hypothetical protein
MTLSQQRLTSQNNATIRHEMLQLPVWGTARLERDGQTVPVRLKALAILYFLALEGQADRQELATMFWDNNDPQSNLRVELHHLRTVLKTLGIDAFGRSQTPLVLPPAIRVDKQRTTDIPLDNLERLTGVSASFEVWLEWHRRSLLEPSAPPSDREALLSELSAKLPKSGLLILQGLPGSDRTAFARGLARWMGLNFNEGLTGNEGVLKYLKSPFPSDLRQQVLSAKGLVVLARSAFGEMPRALLELSEALPAHRVTHLTLPPLSWSEARQGPLSALRFGRAAALYTASQGVPAHLRERLEAEGAILEPGQLPTAPGKMLNKLQLELRYLPMDARIALEKLSVHPARIPDGLAKALEVETHLEEFERRGWLTYRTTWRFAHESVRRILHEGLQPGRRTRTHQRAAAYFAQAGNAVSEAYHSLHAGDVVDWLRVSESLKTPERFALCNWLQLQLNSEAANNVLESMPPLEPAHTQAVHFSPHESALLETARYGDGISEDHGRVTVVRTAAHSERCGVIYAPFEEATLLRVRGRALVENTFGFGLEPNADPLSIGLHRNPDRLRFLAVERAVCDRGTQVILPASEQFEQWMLIPAEQSLHLSSSMERGVIELELTAFDLSERGTPVDAYAI